MNAVSCSQKCSAAILAGGMNSRMGGENKAFLKIGAETILERLLGILTPRFEDVLIVTRQPQAYPGRFNGRAIRRVTDIYDDRASLTGIHAALHHALGTHVLVVACDTPYLQPALISCLCEQISPDRDVIAPKIDGYFQSLCTVYSKTCLPSIAAQLERKVYKIVRFYDKVRVKAVDVQEIKKHDPGLRSFFNINTPAALEAGRKFSGPVR